MIPGAATLIFFFFYVLLCVGKLEGLITLLRATPYNASMRRVYLPQDIMMEQGLSAEQVRTRILLTFLTNRSLFFVRLCRLKKVRRSS